MKYVKFKNNRFCKIFIFLFILAFSFSILVYKSNNKVKAGVIIEEKLQLDSNITLATNNDNIYLRVPSNFSGASVQVTNVYYSNQEYTNYRLGYVSLTSINFEFMHLTLNFSRANLGTTIGLSSGSFIVDYISNNDNTDYCYISIDDIINNIKSIETNGNIIANYGSEPLYCSGQGRLFRKFNAIANVSNIYDLPQHSVCLLYLEDISGLNTNDFAEEITINWGYIDDNNNNTHASYSPTIDIFNDTTNNVIKLSLPQNANGSATTFKEISQNATFSLGDLYEATTTANIYAIYIYLQNDSIYWGYLNFDVPQTPAVPSAQSMQYITGSEQVYAFTYGNTNNMTCRLSISSNVNYITILNQSNFNIDNINSILREGGFFPAWSLYNWSRGARLGYQAGYDAGEAPFREGNAGYQAIFDAGYREGQADSIDTTFLVSLFDSVDAFFNIHLFPLITIGEIVGIPFIISVVWFIIRQLRGGGGAD